MQVNKSKKLGKTSTGAIVLLKANIHCLEPSEVENVAISDHKFKESTP